LIKAVDLHTKSRKEIGALGEKIAAEYLRRHGFSLVETNYTRKTGEIDVIVRGPSGEDTLHFVEVKAIVVNEFPSKEIGRDEYSPSANLHEAKVRKVARTGEWYVLEHDWEGEWQVDGCLVWLRKRDGMARVTYLPQIA
jgi:putative endonuclease